MQNCCNTNNLEVRHINFTDLILLVVKGLDLFVFSLWRQIVALCHQGACSSNWCLDTRRKSCETIKRYNLHLKCRLGASEEKHNPYSASVNNKVLTASSLRLEFKKNKNGKIYACCHFKQLGI